MLLHYHYCERGHFVYSDEQITEGFCAICGAVFYRKCAKCGEKLGERFNSPLYFATDEPVNPPDKPGACGKCGQVFPWTIAEKRRAESGCPGDTAEALIVVRRICRRFHMFARQLRERHDGRPTLDIENEYDVQDALHALLALHFDDIRPEEWTPSYAGKASRTDFLLKGYDIVLETKMTRRGLADKQLGSELIEDLARYGVMQECRHLICLTYDPDERVRNPEGLRKDLESRIGPPFFELFVVPVRSK